MRNTKSFHRLITLYQQLWITCCLLVIPILHSHASSDHEQLSMNGLAAHWTLGREYYIGALYLPQVSSDADTIFAMAGPKRMELKVTNDNWSPRRFAQMWNQAILINNSQDEMNKMSKAIIAFTGLAKDNLVYGDRIIIDYTPDKGIAVSINDTELMTTSHEGFFNILLSTWIGRRPPSSEFKNDILNLSQTEDGQDLIARYDVVLPEAGRAKITAGWAPQKPQPKTATLAKAPKPEPKPEPKKKLAQPKTAETKAVETKTKVAEPVETKIAAVAKETITAKPTPQATATSVAATPEAKSLEKPAASKATIEKVETAKAAPAIALAAPAATAPISKPELPKVSLPSNDKKETISTGKLPDNKTKPAETKVTTSEAKVDEKNKKPESQPVKPTTDTANTEKAVEKVNAQKTAAVAKPIPAKKTKPAVDPEKARITGLNNIYRANMLRYTYRHVVYPSRALNLNQEGTVVLKVTVNRKGKVLDIDHDQRSEYVALNKAAEKAVKKANPYPEVPEDLPGDKFDFKIPIKFRIPR